MFNLFRKKPDQGAEERRKFAHDATVMFLTIQLDLGDATDPEIRKRLFTPYGVGYMIGFAGAHFKEAGVTRHNELRDALTIAFSCVFNAEIGSRLVGVSLGLQEDDEFKSGHKLGSEEAVRWFTEKGFSPLGLTDYLND